MNDQNLRKKVLATDGRRCTPIKKTYFRGVQDIPDPLAGHWTEEESEVARVVIEKAAGTPAVTR